MTRLCIGRDRDPEWWTTGNDGNRLALALCRVCPWRSGDVCSAEPLDDKPTGVIRVLPYSDTGHPLPICRCGYPTVWSKRGRLKPCGLCQVPNVPWVGVLVKRAYDRERYQRRKAAS